MPIVICGFFSWPSVYSYFILKFTHESTVLFLCFDQLSNFFSLEKYYIMYVTRAMTSLYAYLLLSTPCVVFSPHRNWDLGYLTHFEEYCQLLVPSAFFFRRKNFLSQFSFNITLQQSTEFIKRIIGNCNFFELTVYILTVDQDRIIILEIDV